MKLTRYNIIALFVLASMLSILVERSFAAEYSLSETKLIQVPLLRQGTDHTCGVAAVQSILVYYGFFTREDILEKELQAEDFASIKEITRYMSAQGFKVTQHHAMSLADLKNTIDRKLPLLVALQAWADSGTTLEQYKNMWDSGHWVLVIGYDNKNIYVMDPSTAGNYAFVPTDEFMVRWHDQALGEKLTRFGMTFEYHAPAVYNPNRITKME